MFKLITAPTEQAVSLAEAKSHLNVDDSEDNEALIQTLIEAAQKKIEEDYDLSLTAATYDLVLDGFPSIIEIWMWPVASIDSVKYTDDDGDSNTVSSDDYVTELTQKPARIQPGVDYSWPTPRQTVGSVQVRFTTGFTSPDVLPSDIKQALLLTVADWYHNRQDKGRRFSRVSELILMKYKYR